MNLNDVDPEIVLTLVAQNVPRELHQNILVVGSLAAAYHYRAERAGHPVRTKDADVIVQPVGALDECRKIAERLIELEWRRKEDCRPYPYNSPVSELHVIRLYPPNGESYFIELLGLPALNQQENVKWTPIRLQDGWYVVPSFRYMAVLQSNQETSSVGLRYASPALMALANLLAHPILGTQRIKDTSKLRSAKDLGRVLALYFLTPSDDLFGWPEIWWSAIREHFPTEASTLAARVGDGIRALLDDNSAFREAYESASGQLLSGKQVTEQQLRVQGERLLNDVVSELHQLAGGL